MTPETLLQLEDLTVTLGDRPVLQGVSLTIGKGETLGLVGESGSGKSVTALAIAGLLPPGAARTGRVRLGERTLTDLSDRELDGVRGREIGFVFQEPMTALNPVMPIGAQIAEAGRWRPTDRRARVDSSLLEVGLGLIPPGRYPHELSGGQRQRVAMAMALAPNPRLVIADEPTTALDTVTQARIVDLLAERTRARGAALLFITHDLALLARVADRIAVMREGRIVEVGPARELLGRPRDPYTKALRAASVPRRPVPPAWAAAKAPDPTGPPALAVERLIRRHPGARHPAVDGVSLSIAAGETLALVGESGCGKSTLLRCILGLERPQAGRVRIAGLDGLRPTRATRRAAQLVFQDPAGSFDPRWPVWRAVAEPLRLERPRPGPHLAGVRVAELLQRVGLARADLDRYPHEFSGGQRQRLALARALILRPSLLCLDEAVSALDVRVRAQILELLAALKAEFGLAMLFVTHDLGVVRAVADRVVVMEAGRIVEEGTPAQLFAAPAHAATRALMAAAPSLSVPAYA